MTFPFAQPKMPVDELDWPFGSLNDGHLGTAWLIVLPRQLDLMMAFQRPSRQQQVAVSSSLDMDVELKQAVFECKMRCQAIRLIFETAAANIAVNLLQAENVGFFSFNHFEDAVQSITSIATADSFVDVIAEYSHSICSALDLLKKSNAVTDFSRDSKAL